MKRDVTSTGSRNYRNDNNRLPVARDRPVQIMNCTGWYHGPRKHYTLCEQFVGKPGGLENYKSIPFLCNRADL